MYLPAGVAVPNLELSIVPPSQAPTGQIDEILLQNVLDTRPSVRLGRSVSKRYKAKKRTESEPAPPASKSMHALRPAHAVI